MGFLNSLVGGSKQNQESVSGFAALPAEVQEAWLKTFLPKALAELNKPQRPVPMKRVEAPTTPFDSQALYELQQYSDKMGGLFTPRDQAPEQNPYARGNTYGPPLNGGNNTAPTNSNPVADGLSALAQWGMQQVGLDPGWDGRRNAPGVGAIREQYTSDPMEFLKKNNIVKADSVGYRLLSNLLGFS